MADGKKVGNAWLLVGAKTDSSFESTLDKAGSSAGDSAGNLFNAKFGGALKKLGGILGTLKIGQMVGETIADSIKAYADYEQLVGGVETLFKESADLVQDYAKKAYKTAGLSANDYMETVTSFSASLLQSLEGDTVKAADYADMAIKDMSDNANKMGTSMESIQYAYQGFAKQNYTMLDNLKLGYGGTRTEMERLLKDAEKITGIKYDISNLSDVYEAIHVIQTELGITGTTAQEAEHTISGSLNSLKASWQNLLVALSDPQADFSAIFGEMVESASSLLANAIPILGNLLGEMIVQLPDVIVQLTPVLVDAVARMVLKVGEKFQEGLDSIFTDFGNWVADLVNGSEEAGDGIAEGLGDGVQTANAELDQFTKDTLAKLDSMPDSAYSSGRSVPASFGQGILDNFSAAIDPMAALADAASGYLPHSPAKYGAFSGKGYPLYSGMAIAESLGEGFTRKIGYVQAQIANGMRGVASAINGGGNYNITMNVAADSNTTIDNLIEQANRRLGRMGAM